MISAVVNENTKKLVYAVNGDLHNVCTERDMLNSRHPMLDAPYIVVCGIKNIAKYCNLKANDVRKVCRVKN